MQRKRCKAGISTAFASITTMMLVAAVARIAIADDDAVKLNPFTATPAPSDGPQNQAIVSGPLVPVGNHAPVGNDVRVNLFAAVPSGTKTSVPSKADRRPIRIAPPANSPVTPTATPNQPARQATEVNPVPDEWLKILTAESELSASDAETSTSQAESLDAPMFYPPQSGEQGSTTKGSDATDHFTALMLPEEIPIELAEEPADESAKETATGETAPAEPAEEPTNKSANETVPAESKTDQQPETLPAPAAKPVADQAIADPANETAWWEANVNDSILDQPRWVRFNLDTVLVDTLQNSPLIRGVSHRTSVAAERIVQQDAVFDPNMLFNVNGGQTNDPVGNILVTGGAPRLQEPSMDVEGGFTRTTRHGGNVGLTQQFGLLDSNSDFFTPLDQGNTRLSLSLTQPLFARGGKVYNERLLTQARIDHKIAWQDMRAAVENRVSEVMATYWRLYELRCHVIQQRALLKRGEHIEQLVTARARFDSSRIEVAKAKQRVARRIDQLIELQAEVRKQQARLATLIGSEALQTAESHLEMIPHGTLWFPDVQWDLRDAVVRGLQFRPEVKAAAGELESAALEVQVTRTELVPQLNAVVDAYLSALNGGFAIGQSFVDQFENGPGYLAGLQYEMPRGRRSAKSRHREAHHRYKQKNAELREAIQRTRFEVESALIDVRRAAAQKTSKQQLLITATDEETALTRRWEMMAGDGGNVGVVLENLLDAQQRTTDAEREWVSARTEYLISLVDLQRAMGTLLMTEAITPARNQSDCSIEFIRGEPVIQRKQPTERMQQGSHEFDQFMNTLEHSSQQQPATKTEKP